MVKNFNIKPPFFEVGPKAIIWGEEMLALAKVLDKIAMKYDVDIIVTPQYTDIKLIADNTERILVFAQHMDALVPGRGLGSVLPEAVKAAGAVGVMLNHAEKPLDMETLEKTIRRADEVGLATIVCADTVVASPTSSARRIVFSSVSISRGFSAWFSITPTAPAALTASGNTLPSPLPGTSASIC